MISLYHSKHFAKNRARLIGISRKRLKFQSTLFFPIDLLAGIFVRRYSGCGFSNVLWCTVIEFGTGLCMWHAFDALPIDI